MSLFASDRERRLWLWALAVVVAIYSTLGLATRLAGLLRENGLLEASFVAGLMLVGATVFTQAIRSRPGGTEIFVGLGIAAAYMLVFVRMSSPEERTHLIEYGVLSVFIYEALAERMRQGRRVRFPALLAILMASTVGVIDECIQAFLPDRVFDPLDMLFNVLASSMAVLGSGLLTWARGRRRRRRERG